MRIRGAVWIKCPTRFPDQNIADIVLHNGHVQTMASEGDVASAVAIAGNKIVYVGDDSGIDAFVGDNAQVIDLDGKFVSPGFIDGHIHAPGNWFTKLYQIDLTGLSTDEEYLKAIRSTGNQRDSVIIGAANPSGLRKTLPVLYTTLMQKAFRCTCTPWATAPFTAPLMPSRRLGRPMGSATRGTRSPTYAPLPMRISSAWPIWM